MKSATDFLQEVVVQSPPMRIRKDTIEYNAASFATKPNAVAEDQLKKLPGVQVDASGNITAQGEKVQRILVNGKRFFGDDPKLATRTLPPISSRNTRSSTTSTTKVNSPASTMATVSRPSISLPAETDGRDTSAGPSQAPEPTRPTITASTSTASTTTSRSPSSAKATISTNRTSPPRTSSAPPAADAAAAAAPLPPPTAAAQA
ncbi:hypothetical protein ACQ86N_31055 [Puia sp. P3]|uniref:hypothetical protein n=1 Tax=Puia sp. P3 TaxID=3423952 RepID=UPI003D67A6D6